MNRFIHFNKSINNVKRIYDLRSDSQKSARFNLT